MARHPVSARLRQARIKKGYETAKDAAAFFAWNQHTYRGHENGSRPPPSRSLMAYAKAFGVTTDWLLNGIESNSNRRQATVSQGQAIPLVRWDELPRERARMSGVISRSQNGAIVAPMKVGADQQVCAVTVEDDSMSPRYEVGDQVCIDVMGRVAPGKIVVYWDDDTEQHYIRKVQVLPGNKIRLVPLNADHRTLDTDISSPGILGVVVAVFRLEA